MSSLRERLLAVADRNRDRTALWVQGTSYTYADLFDRAAVLSARFAAQPQPLCLVYCGKNLTRYVAILASVLSGKAFVPLCPSSPPSYCERVLRQLEGEVMAVLDTGDATADARLAESLAPSDPVVSVGPLPPPAEGAWASTCTRPTHDPGGGAYLMFTSGSTGAPKAVLVTVDNLTAYLDGAIALFSPTVDDRFAQVNNVAFDLSVHDVFLPWSVGASVYALPDTVYKLPELVREHELTFWLSVPTTGLSLADLRLLAPGSLPGLRCTLFCGEPLPRRLAEIWHAANPDGRLLNIYGPTECTIAVTAFEWTVNQDVPDVVPIGWPYPGQGTCLVDDSLREVPDGAVGELCLSGTQLVPGYYRNLEATTSRFVTLQEHEGVWYRTGDLATRHAVWGLTFAGRRDDQLQVRGTRVERLEVETLIKKLLGTDSVAVVGWPIVDGALVQGLVGFVADIGLEAAEIRRRITRELPEHMWPSQVHVGPLPQNRSRKVDYPALKRRLAGVDAP